MRTFTAASLFVYEWGREGDPVVLYWDGLGGTGLHANEIAPILVSDYGLRVVAPDAPGHGRSPPVSADGFRPSALAGLAALLLSELDVERGVFVGFSWGGRVGCSFAARYPQRTSSLVLVEGGIFLSEHGDRDLAAWVAEAQREADEESFPSWEAFFAYERESLGRWTPAVAEAHRAVMREEGGRVVPILGADSLGAIRHGEAREPVTATYEAIVAARVPVLLAYTPRESVEGPVRRFTSALPGARVETLAGIHDLISVAPERVAHLVGSFATEHSL